jgi:hypothetical protein
MASPRSSFQVYRTAYVPVPPVAGSGRMGLFPGPKIRSPVNRHPPWMAGRSNRNERLESFERSQAALIAVERQEGIDFECGPERQRCCQCRMSKRAVPRIAECFRESFRARYPRPPVGVERLGRLRKPHPCRDHHLPARHSLVFLVPGIYSEFERVAGLENRNRTNDNRTALKARLSHGPLGVHVGTYSETMKLVSANALSSDPSRWQVVRYCSAPTRCYPSFASFVQGNPAFPAQALMGQGPASQSLCSVSRFRSPRLLRVSLRHREKSSEDRGQ